MRITSLHVRGLRSVKDALVAFPPGETVRFFGPNGSSKTTRMGAIVFALTGRYPGIGPTKDDLRALAQDDVGFVTSVEALGEDVVGPVIVRVARELHADKLTVGVTVRYADGRTAQTSKPTEAAQILRVWFGDVQFLVDAFDPEKSLWRKSPEQRAKWLFELCPSGWTREKLAERSSAFSDDWDPKADPSPTACVALNLTRIEGLVRLAQKTARDARTTADGIVVPALDDVAMAARVGRLTKATAEREGAQVELSRVQAALAQAEAAQEQRERLTRQLAEIDRDLAAMVPPEAPGPWPLQAEVEEAAACVAQLEIQADDRAEAAALHQQEAEDLLRAARALRVSPTDRDVRLLRHAWARHVGLDREEPDGMALRLADAIERVLAPPSDDALCAAEQRLTDIARVRGVHDQKLQQYQRDAADFQMTYQTRLATKQRWQESLAKLFSEVDVEAHQRVARAQQRYDDAREEERSAQAARDADRVALALRSERAAQEKAADEAAARGEALKVLVEKIRGLRAEMQKDNTAPLREALQPFQALAGEGWTFDVVPVDAGVDIGLCRAGTFFSADLLSTGERYRVTCAVTLAAQVLRRAPWKALFCDNAEALGRSGADALCEALGGLCDNAVVAGAFDMPEVST